MSKTKKIASGQLSLFAEVDLASLSVKAPLDQSLAEAETERLAKLLGFGLVTGLNKHRQEVTFLTDDLLADLEIEARWYLLRIAYDALKANALVVLPTGLGKTYVSVVMMASKLKTGVGKILLLAPTKPLCNQHKKVLRRLLPKTKVGLLTGKIAKQKRLSIWQSSEIIVATPQTIDLALSDPERADNFKGISDVFFDEVHHLRGKYAYAKLAEHYQMPANLVTAIAGLNTAIRFYGLTASPDWELEATEKLRKILRVSPQQVLARSFDSPDVLPYQFSRTIEPWFLDHDLSKLQAGLLSLMTDELNHCLDNFKNDVSLQLAEYVFLDKEKRVTGLKIKKFKEVSVELWRIAQEFRQPEHYEALIYWALAMKFNWAIRFLHKGLSEFAKFLVRQYGGPRAGEKLKKSQEFFRINRNVQFAVKELCQYHLWGKHPLPDFLQAADLEFTGSWQIALRDPKLRAMTSLVRQFYGQRILIFTEYRDTLRKVKYLLEKTFSELPIGYLTGTGRDFKGQAMSQPEQEAVVAKFFNDEIKLLVCTSVGEEGLDFPSIDLVVFYEPIEDARRYVQRIGRAARHNHGTVYLLIYKKSEEVAIYRTALAREKKMNEVIKYYQSQNPI